MSWTNFSFNCFSDSALKALQKNFIFVSSKNRKVEKLTSFYTI